MNEKTIPEWIQQLDDDDYEFMRRFIKHSGSLKKMAEIYEVSYPTVRARLDRLIDKIVQAEQQRPVDAFHQTLQKLVVDGTLSSTNARTLLNAHWKTIETNGPSRSEP